MAEEIVLYYNPMSRARTILWMLEEIGANYRIEIVNLQKNEQKQSRFLAINPMGKLPTITHRGVVVTECGAIISYLADAFPAARLAPALDDPARGTYLRWMFFGAGCVDPALVDTMLQRPAASQPTAVGYGSLDNVLSTLEKALTPGPYLLGDRFSAADLFIAAQLGFGTMTKAIGPHPVFQAYLERTSQRPAYQRHMQKNQQFLPPQQATG